MRLLNTETQRFEWFDSSESPPYAILSHTWSEDEVTFEEVQNLSQDELRARKGYEKILFTTREARSDCMSYVWIDTCCINKLCSVELTEAINSMFSWYSNAAICYVYLSDVQLDTMADRSSFNTAFAQSRWFSRGWTLQELLAPRHVAFFGERWSWLGTKQELRQRISRAAGIPEQVLEDPNKLYKCSAAQKMSWAANRRTTRIEDMAYCLLGIFDVRMPLQYGEGERAFYRLQQEILKTTNDLSLLAWSGSGMRLRHILADSPRDFLGAGSIVEETGHQGIGKGYHNTLTMPLPKIPLSNHYDSTHGSIAIVDQRKASMHVGDVVKKESQILAWVMETAKDSIHSRNRHSRAAPALEQSKEEKATLLGALEEGSQVYRQLRSHTSYDPFEDEEWAMATYDEITDDCRSESSEANTEESNSTASVDSDASHDELLIDIVIDVLVEVIIERKGMPWHLLDGENDAYVNAQDGYYSNAIYAASAGGYEQMVKLLLNKDANRNILSGDLGNALQAVSEGGYEQVVKTLIDNGADVNAKDTLNQTPLLWAASKGFSNIVRMLLARAEIDQESRDVLFGQCPLFWASKTGHASVVQLLLPDEGISGDYKDNFGRTPLALAAANGHRAVVELLLTQCSIDPYFKDAFGYTLMSLTAKRGNRDILDLFQDKCKQSGLPFPDSNISTVPAKPIRHRLCPVCLPNIENGEGNFNPCVSCLTRRSFYLDNRAHG